MKPLPDAWGFVSLMERFMNKLIKKRNRRKIYVRTVEDYSRELLLAVFRASLQGKYGESVKNLSNEARRYVPERVDWTSDYKQCFSSELTEVAKMYFMGVRYAFSFAEMVLDDILKRNEPRLNVSADAKEHYKAIQKQMDIISLIQKQKDILDSTEKQKDIQDLGQKQKEIQLKKILEPERWLTRVFILRKQKGVADSIIRSLYLECRLMEESELLEHLKRVFKLSFPSQIRRDIRYRFKAKEEKNLPKEYRRLVLVIKEFPKELPFLKKIASQTQLSEEKIRELVKYGQKNNKKIEIRESQNGEYIYIP